MTIPLHTQLALLAAAGVITLALATVPDRVHEFANTSEPTAAARALPSSFEKAQHEAMGCDTDTDCLVKFCMAPGATCDGGPEPARP